MLSQLIVSGIAIGALYGFLGLSIALIYKATDVFNFAQGEMVMVMTFFAYTTLVMWGLPYPIGLLITLCFAALFGFALERVIIRPVINAPPITIIMISLALFALFNYSARWIWFDETKNFPSPFSETPIDLLGVVLTPVNLGVIVIACLLGVGLYLFFKYTKIGLLMRATADDKFTARLVGINVGNVFSMTWVLASVLGAVTGFLLAPITFLGPQMMADPLLRALAGGVIGGFTNLPGVVIGGVILGILENLVGYYISSAFKGSLPFIVIIVFLFFRPTGLFGEKMEKKV